MCCHINEQNINLYYNLTLFDSPDWRVAKAPQKQEFKEEPKQGVADFPSGLIVGPKVGIDFSTSLFNGLLENFCWHEKPHMAICILYNCMVVNHIMLSVNHAVCMWFMLFIDA